MEEYRKELEELKAEVKSLREDLQELKTSLFPLTQILRGNGFKMAVFLISTGTVIALVGMYHFINTAARYVIDLIRAFRGV